MVGLEIVSKHRYLAESNSDVQNNFVQKLKNTANILFVLNIAV
ncbi:hypothetical protein HanPSC8_Chr06g0262801 [Helianthus annuus]|nr:hypothetical protein HanPSC8_Chr06g0262801 [Helianthus annuus]